MQKITTFLTFEDQAEAAMNFYLSVFRNGKIVSTVRMGGAGSALLIATVELFGQEFYFLNGGPHFSFSQGISLFVSCDTQAEIDEYYHKLSEGGSQQPCGWLIDKFGVSWQIIPPILGTLLHDKDPQKSQKVLQAMIQMQKIDIQKLKDAHAG